MNNKIDITGPIKTIIYGIVLAIIIDSNILANIINLIPNKDYNDYTTTHAKIITSYYIASQNKFIVCLNFQHDKTPYVVYVYTDNDVTALDSMSIEFANNNPKNCKYEGEKYVAQPIISKIRQ